MAKFKVFDLFPNSVHEKVLNRFSCNVQAAYAYNNYLETGHVLGADELISRMATAPIPAAEATVSRQLVRYWRKVMVKCGGKQAKANRELREARKTINPSPSDDVGNTVIPEMCHRILVVGDLHAPYTHPDALAFLEHVRNDYGPDMVVQVGDETDGHAISFHDSDPNLDSAGVELEKAKVLLAKFHKLFPNLLVCDSNHGSLVFRRAKAHGLPVQMIKRYRDILFPQHGAPGWSWADGWNLNTPLGTVRFQHQVSGDIMTNAAHERTSLVIGHEHGKFNVTYAASSTALYFGAYAGCLIDKKSMAFAYGKLHKNKPILGCMVITEGNPQLIPMLLDDTGRWVGAAE